MPPNLPLTSDGLENRKIGCRFKLSSLRRFHPVSASCHEWVSRAWCDLDGGEQVVDAWWWVVVAGEVEFWNWRLLVLHFCHASAMRWQS